MATRKDAGPSAAALNPKLPLAGGDASQLCPGGNTHKRVVLFKPFASPSLPLAPSPGCGEAPSFVTALFVRCWALAQLGAPRGACGRRSVAPRQAGQHVGALLGADALHVCRGVGAASPPPARVFWQLQDRRRLVLRAPEASWLRDQRGGGGGPRVHPQRALRSQFKRCFRGELVLWGQAWRGAGMWVGHSSVRALPAPMGVAGAPGSDCTAPAPLGTAGPYPDLLCGDRDPHR